MSNPYLLLWLEAPLQSWGVDSKFGRRDTLDFPTKSGILGLLCCALGASGEQRELLESMASLKQSVLSFVRTKTSGDQLSIKKERETLLCDFHMVGSGYDDQDPWQTLLIPKTIDGKPAVGGGSKMTYRYYLQDAIFAVALEVPEGMASTFVAALKSPVWDIYLGRKSCVPTDFIFRGLFLSEKDALAEAIQIANEKNLAEDFYVRDGVYDGEVLFLNDVPLQFGEHKIYRERRVTVGTYGSDN